MVRYLFQPVMPGLVPGIHVLLQLNGNKTWMAGTSPAMTPLVLRGGVLKRREGIGKAALAGDKSA